MTTLRFVEARVADRETCTVTLRGHGNGQGRDITLIVAVEDIGKIVSALAGIAAVAAAQKEPAAGSVIGDALLPVTECQVGFSKLDGEPVLVLTSSGGVVQHFQMPQGTAKQMGEALLIEAGRAAPGGKSS